MAQLDYHRLGTRKPAWYAKLLMATGPTLWPQPFALAFPLIAN